MYNIRKGSIIQESRYFTTLTCEIVSEVEILFQDKPRTNQQKFTAKIVEIDGIPSVTGKLVEYLVGGTYGASITVLEY